MSHKDYIVIVAAKRTPMGAFQGQFKDTPSTALGSAAIHGALTQANVPANNISGVLMGCVLPAGLGQAPARQAAIGAGLPTSTPCTTISKVCGSGMEAVILAHDSLLCHSADILVAGGMENMTRAPYLLDKARSGYRMGHGQLIDHMFCDGLEDAYNHGKLMGQFAEDTAAHYKFTRQMQDTYAIESTRRALQAIADDCFQGEITPVTVHQGKEDITIAVDEPPLKVNIDRIPMLRAAFKDGGTVTAANASSIADGASALVLMRESYANDHGYTIHARIIGHARHAQEPAWFTTAPISAIEKLVTKVGWHLDEVDLFEVNEAFAVVAMVTAQKLNIPHDRMNIYGGACALGHPIGASGARIITTLLSAMTHKNVARGIASICIGGGEATAIALERVTG